MHGDFVIRASEPDATSGSSVAMPESLAASVRAADGVAHVDTMSMVRDCRVRRSGGGGRAPRFHRARGPADRPEGGKPGNAARSSSPSGEVVIGTVLSQRTGKGVGDEIDLETREGVKRLRVAGTTNAYLVGGLVIYMEGAIARKLLERRRRRHVHGRGRRRPAGRGREASLKAICEQHGLMLHSFAELRAARSTRKLNGVVGGLWGLLALLFVVAAFGIANTLTINVLEQTRDLALLRVVAMTRRQVRKTILAQAAIIGLIGLITGTVGGIIGAFVINLCSFALLGRIVDFALQPLLLGVCFGLGLVVVLVAAWLPAERRRPAQPADRPAIRVAAAMDLVHLNVLGVSVLIWLGSLAAGFLGRLTGLGGGVVIVPLLTLVFHVDIRYAIGASLVSVIATSSGAAAAYVKEGYHQPAHRHVSGNRHHRWAPWSGLRWPRGFRPTWWP